MNQKTFEISGEESEVVISFPHKFSLNLRSNETLFFAFKDVDTALIKLLTTKNNNGGKAASPTRHLMNTDCGWLMITNQRLLFYGAAAKHQFSWQQILQWRSFRDGFSIRLNHTPFLYRFSGIHRYKIFYELQEGFNAIVPMNGSVLREVLDMLHKTLTNSK
ncbi:MAG: hypothetical protein JEZ00_21250 [Anaerolineaceae bacterium]|nr:hypothetical protein [Anaerolineaceae bacterium]